MFLLPGADGNWSCNERGNERMMNGNCCFIIAERLARNNITSSPLCPHGTFRTSLSLLGDVSVLLFQTCCNENKQPGLGFCVLITRHFMLHFDLIRIKWLFLFSGALKQMGWREVWANTYVFSRGVCLYVFWRGYINIICRLWTSEGRLGKSLILYYYLWLS